MRSAYLALLENFPKANLLLLGDTILDAHHTGTITGVSSESPSLVIERDKSSYSLGGAALVARNILELGGRVTFLSSAGRDKNAEHVRKFDNRNLKAVFFEERGRETIVKERFIAGGYKLLHWRKTKMPAISRSTEKSIVSFIQKNISKFDKIVISDYRHGFITESLAQKVISLAKKYRKPVYVDSQISEGFSGSRFWFRDADVMLLNQKEARSVFSGFAESKLRSSLSSLKKILRVKNVVVKLGKNGSAALVGETFFSVKELPVKAVDPVGAGDAFLAAIALAPGKVTKQALGLANVWAALSTTIPGTEPAKKEMLVGALKRDENASVRHRR